MQNPYEKDNTIEGLKKFRDWEINQTKDLKSNFSEILNTSGEDFIESINKKNKKKEKLKQKQIRFILNKTNEYDEEYLQDLFFDDIKSIYVKVKQEKKSFFIKLIEFAFGV